MHPLKVIIPNVKSDYSSNKEREETAALNSLKYLAWLVNNTRNKFFPSMCF